MQPKSRRDFLRAGVALTASAFPAPAAPSPAPAATGRAEDALEEALERFAPTGPEFSGGLANHGPMASEALFTLGRADAVEHWVDAYRKRLGPAPVSHDPIRETDWTGALGRIDRVADWTAFFDRQLGEGPWESALSTWTRRLAPGLVAAATHGLIRTGHAVRSLARKDTPLRRHELAEGLGYWAARYYRLPEAQGATVRPQLPSEAIGSVARVPDERQVHSGNITDRLAPLSDFAPFPDVADLVDPSGDPSRFLSDLTATFARVYLEQAQSGMGVITFIHSVTGPSAVRLLLPHVPPDVQSSLLRYAWQAAAGFYAALGRPPATPAPSARVPSPADLVDRAVGNGDEHAIKFTEACLREHALLPRPVFLEAARDATSRLRG
jgi:hypothetical protein